MLNKYNRPAIRHGIRSEKRVAKRLGGKLTPGSGNQSHSKGDFHTSTFLFENKATKNKSFTFKKAWFDKIIKEANDVGKMPALAFQFVDALGVSDNSWVAVKESDFKALMDLVEDDL